MKKDPVKSAMPPKRIELDQEVIADLVATDADHDAIRGGQRPTTWCRAAG